MRFSLKLLLNLICILLFISDGEATTIYSTSILSNKITEPYFKAIRKNDIQTIQSLIKSGVDVNNATENGYTPLMAATNKGNLEIIKLLISAGADVEAIDYNGDTPLFFALYDSEKEEVVRYIVEGLNASVNHMNDSERTPLILAALNDHSKSLKFLISARAKIETKGNRGATALFHATSNGSLKAVKVLLDFGAQLEARDQNGFTPLMEAVFNNDGSMIRFLLKAGADKHVCATERISVLVKKDWTDFIGKTVYIPEGATLIDIARQFNKRVAENILINEAGF